MTRLERKLAEVQRWVDSVEAVVDWPAAIILGMLRTRPTGGRGVASRVSRALFPYVWVRPRRLGGLSLRIDPAAMSQFVIYEEVFIRRIYDLDLVAFTPDVIVDCGAFEGYFSLLAHAKFASAPIVAFEPNPRNYQGLIANFQRNQLSIEPRAEAVSTANGTATFSGDGCGGHLGGHGADPVEVQVCDLRIVIAELKPHQLLLKLDIEGEEATLLPALMPVLPRRCAIFFEWHQGHDEFRRVTLMLADHGFTTAVTRTNQADNHAVCIDAFAQRL